MPDPITTRGPLPPSQLDSPRDTSFAVSLPNTPQSRAANRVAIELRNLSAWYGDFQSLRDISFDIPANRVTALIGPSGCGKSTLLRWINRMNDTIPGARASGTLQLGDTDLLARSTDVVDLRRRIGIVFQRPNPFPKSIFDNVAFGPRLHMRMTRSQLQDVVEWCFARPRCGTR